MGKPVILTGIRSTNELHIGNYFGALLPMIDMATRHAEDYQINLFVPDLHSFTTPVNHAKLYAQTMTNIRLYLAAGLPIDHPDVHIYRQSFIPAHSELAWILNCFTGVGEMNRMTQFKDKSAKLSANRVSVGLLSYPTLMAADILLYGALYIPVGDDQSQHIEFTRDIAERLNRQFGELFVLPKTVEEQHKFFGKDQGLRIKDLVDPTKKMSKSDGSAKGVIFLSDDPEVAVKKVMAATTDSVGQINFDPNKQPGVTNLLQIIALLSATDQNEVTARWQGKASYSELKQEAAACVSKFLGDFQAKLKTIDDQALNDHLAASEKAMNDQANAVLAKVQQAVGLRA